jgi:3-oxoacyl-[acyl-carrier-protein] synthase II
MHADRPTRRVVVTGRGVISPIGLTVADFWASLMAGKSGIKTITSYDASEEPVRIGGEVVGFEPTKYLPRKVARRIDKFAHYAIAASTEALEEAKLSIDEDLSPRTGVLIGSALGANTIQHEGAITYARRGYRGMPPWISAGAAIDSVSSEVATLMNVQGPSSSVSSACSSSITAISAAMRLIQCGITDVMLTGGADNGVTSTELGGAHMARALSTRNDEPELACRPFDAARDGFVMSAGAGILVLEEAEHAIRRGAPIIAELLGCGESSDCYHPSAPHPEGRGAKQAMRMALAQAGLEPSDVDYINAHGTSTVLNDRVEIAAIREVFGAHAEQIPISSTKSSTGHMLGAAGAVELIACIQAILDSTVPPTLNCDNPEDPGINFVAHRPQERDVTVALSNSFGFGGHNAVAVVRSWPQ